MVKLLAFFCIFLASSYYCYAAELISLSGLRNKLLRSALSRYVVNTGKKTPDIRLKKADDVFPEVFIESVKDSVGVTNNISYTVNDDLVEQEQPFFCYRGQYSTNWPLAPSLARRSDLVDKVSYSMAQRLPHGVILHGHDPVAQLSMLQHHGVPTSLLDWTTNLRTAMFYALNGLSKTSDFPNGCALFILDPYSLNKDSRVTGRYGIHSNGLALPSHFDSIVRAINPYAHSHFELSRNKEVIEAGFKDGFVVASRREEKGKLSRYSLKLFCERLGIEIPDNEVKYALSRPVAIFPEWTDNNDRVRILESIFTLSGIYGENDHNFYQSNTIKISLDESCCAELRKYLQQSKDWQKVRELSESENDKAFLERQKAFDSMLKLDTRH